MAHHRRSSLLFLVLFSCLVCSSYSYQFVVGGRDGWVVKPSENYNHWAGRMRFQVNDTLLFKYKSGSDSVVVVNKDDYDKCNAANPIAKFDDGNTIFKFNRSGPFYFITANKPNCDHGQKMIIVVLAIRTPPSSPLVPPPTASPPHGSSPSLSPTPAPSVPGTSPPSPSPSSGAPAPATSPPAPSPGSESPAPGGSAPAPEGASPGAPGSATPGSPGASVPGSPGASAPGSGTAADANAPPSPKGSAAAGPCSSVLLIVMSVSLGVFVMI